MNPRTYTDGTTILSVGHTGDGRGLRFGMGVMGDGHAIDRTPDEAREIARFIDVLADESDMRSGEQTAPPVFEVVGKTDDLLTIRVRASLGAMGAPDFLAPLGRDEATALMRQMQDWLETDEMGQRRER